MKKIQLYILLTFSIASYIGAQTLTPIGYNHSIKKQLEENSGLKSTEPAKDVMLAPPFPTEDFYFFDDFIYSQHSVFPDPALWSDNYAFINQTYGDSCISIGMATLDGVDEKGDLYAKVDGPVPSDTLTSIDIPLDEGENNVYISFFYQGGGKGDAPEINDSLILEFYKTDSNKWYPQWYSLGFDTNNFIQVVLEIDNSFKGNAFKFRFRNWTSTSKDVASGEDEGSIANSDIWNIDYVQVKNAANADEMLAINDAAFIEPLLPAHKTYNTLPYGHMKYTQTGYKEQSKAVIRTTFKKIPKTTIGIRRDVQTYNTYHGQNIYLGGLIDEVYENSQYLEEVRTYTDDFAPGYKHNEEQEYGDFEYISFIEKVNEDNNQWNDTLKKREVYKDFYAYDDGTAEYGFGMPGNGGINMRLAYKYALLNTDSNPEDTLTGIDIHFVKTRNNASSDVEFQLCVWDDNEGEPGKLLYPSVIGDELQGETFTVDTNLKINELKRFNLEQDLMVRNNIYIGLVQLNEGNLGIGYDVNSNSRSSIYTNDGNQWRQVGSSLTAGSLMMRPVFGHHNYVSTINVEAKRDKNLFKVYPNPARGVVYIKPLTDYSSSVDYLVNVYNLMGQQLLSRQLSDGGIDLEDYPNGLYLIRITNQNNSTTETHKILKQ